jgi:hypothetical protein
MLNASGGHLLGGGLKEKFQQSLGFVGGDVAKHSRPYFRTIGKQGLP